MALLRCGFVVCALLGLIGTAQGATIDFDDLAETFDDALPSPYAGFGWENFRYYSFDANTGFPEWQAGIASEPNAAYSGGELFENGGEVPYVGTISRATPFDFVSATFGSLLYGTMDLIVEGYLGNTLKFSQTLAVDNTGADLFMLNFTNIDRVRIFGSDNPNDPCGTSNCSLFAIDDFTWQQATTVPTNVPEPSTLALLGAGVLVGLGQRRVRRRR